jgi:2-hydroxychromene-2-carboxylate isomerase
LLGGLFRDLGTPMVPLDAMPAPKRAHQLVELSRAAKRLDVPFRFCSRFPVNTVKALRLTLACPASQQKDLVARLFRAVWAEDRDVSNDDELRAIAEAAGLDMAAVWPEIAAPRTKDLLRSATDEAKARGVFGVPTIFVEDEPFWGQDKLPSVARTLGAPTI